VAITPEVESALKQLRPDLELCPKCRCCEMMSEPCESCNGEGVYIEEADGIETDEDEAFTCDICLGKGYFTFCCGECDENGKHDKRGL
jgi:DnaJ-class molecular chaperone